jgi:hypothetical protein
LTRDALDFNNRAYIGVSPASQPFYLPQLQPTLGEPLQMYVGYPDFGRLPADAEITSIVEYSLADIFRPRPF